MTFVYSNSIYNHSVMARRKWFLFMCSDIYDFVSRCDEYNFKWFVIESTWNKKRKREEKILNWSENIFKATSTFDACSQNFTYFYAGCRLVMVRIHTYTCLNKQSLFLRETLFCYFNLSCSKKKDYDWVCFYLRNMALFTRKIVGYLYLFIFI